jgi:NAD-dependent dihydropyrimidine dehydrogenase PreA subunit
MVHSIMIDMSACTGCKTCMDICFVDVIRWNEETGKPVAAYPEDCQICGLCEILCPEKAIKIVPDWVSRQHPVLAKKGR